MTKKKKPPKKLKPSLSPERKREKWQKYAKRRVERYRSDPEYRAKIQADVRARMQKRRETDLRDCRKNIAEVGEMGTRRMTFIHGEPSVRNTYTVREAAEALMVSLSHMRVWIKDNIIPAPVVKAAMGEYTHKNQHQGNTANVYLKGELVAMMRLVGEHRTRSAYIRRGHHDDVIEKIATAMADERRRTGLD